MRIVEQTTILKSRLSQTDHERTGYPPERFKSSEFRAEKRRNASAAVVTLPGRQGLEGREQRSRPRRLVTLPDRGAAEVRPLLGQSRSSSAGPPGQPIRVQSPPTLPSRESAECHVPVRRSHQGRTSTQAQPGSLRLLQVLGLTSAGGTERCLEADAVTPSLSRGLNRTPSLSGTPARAEFHRDRDSGWPP